MRIKIDRQLLLLLQAPRAEPPPQVSVGPAADSQSLMVANPDFLQGRPFGEQPSTCYQMPRATFCTWDSSRAPGLMKNQTFQAELMMEILGTFKKNRSSSRATVGFSWKNTPVQLQELFQEAKSLGG